MFLFVSLFGENVIRVALEGTALSFFGLPLSEIAPLRFLDEHVVTTVVEIKNIYRLVKINYYQTFFTTEI